MWRVAPAFLEQTGPHILNEGPQEERICIEKRTVDEHSASRNLPT